MNPQLVVAAFIGWFLILIVVACFRSRSWVRWLIVVPLVLLLARNPFGSSLAAEIFLVAVWVLDVLFALSFPLLWWSRQLGAGGAFLSIVLLTLPSILKGAVPRNRLLGVTLATLFGPWGHWYWDDGGFWVVEIWASAVTIGLIRQLVRLHWGAVGASHALELPTLWLGWPGAIFHVVSGVLMYFRSATVPRETVAQ